MYRSIGKRIFDIILVSLGIIVLFPILIGLSIWIKLSSKGPLIYKQERLGKNFEAFYLYKFRSMIVDADKKGISVTSSDDNRITKVGKLIRKYKIDELPQLYNVLIGDMSIVGPRPEVKRYIDFYRKEYENILSVKPGITDNAAIVFRNEEEELSKYEDKEKAYIEIILPKKIELYNKYISEISLVNDIKLIIKTLNVI